MVYAGTGARDDFRGQRKNMRAINAVMPNGRENSRLGAPTL
jgi:hypothetical protein